MRFLLMLMALVAAVTGAPETAIAQAAAPAAARMSAEQWREDLRFMVDEMERRHPNLYHKVSRDAFRAEVANLDAGIPKLQRHQIIVGMMRIAAMVGDGHTRVEPRKDPAFQFRSLPLKLHLFDDGLYVRAAKPEQAALVGGLVEAIGGTPVAEAVRRATELASGENASGPRLYVPFYLAMPDVLHALALSDGRDSASLTLVKDGRRSTVRVAAGEVEPRWPPDTDISLVTPEGWVDGRSAPPPAWLQAPLDYHRLIAMPDRNALYAQLNMVTDIDGQTLTAFGEKILEAARDSDPRTIVLDLRLNQGGNGDLRHGFVRSLIKAVDADTRLVILTARGTFSASQFLLNDLVQLADATIVGEASGSSPTHYGDAYRSTLPNSGITIRTSIKYWQSGQDKRPWTPVDLAPAYRYGDYAAGRDPALEAALKFDPSQLVINRIGEAAAKGAEAIAAVAGDPLYRYADVELAGWRTAMRLLRSGAKQPALTLARWTAVKFPRSPDAATVLAMVADANGLKDEARRAAETAIALDPNNRFVRPILERTGA